MAEERGEDWAAGLALFRDIYGDGAADALVSTMENPETFGSEQMRWTIDWNFGRIWTREGLERRMRSASVIGMLIAQGATEEIKFHTRMGLKNGLTKTEIEEIFYTAIAYCGFPKAADAKRAMLAGFAEAEKAQS